MMRIVLMCNAPAGLKEELERHRSRFLSTTDRLFTLREARIDQIYERLQSAYKTTGTRDHYDACAVVFVLNSTEQALDKLRSASFGLIFRAAPLIPHRLSRKHLHNFINFIRQELVHIRKLVAALMKEFRERDTKTPLLLPV